MLTVLASCNTNPNQASTQQAQGVATADNIYNIETAQSQITWTGREVSTSSHYGTLDFVSGNFEISNGAIVNGEFIVDMTSICLLYTSPSPRDVEESRMPSSA